MSTLTIIFIVACAILLSLATCYLDAKYQWRLTDWLNGTCKNPFTPHGTSNQQQLIKQKDAQIEALQKRVETLEAIVTEPAFELNQKINALK